MIDVILAEDHQIVREGFTNILEGEDDMRVVTTTGDGSEATDLVIEHEPDVFVVDLNLPGLNGLSVIRQVTQHVPETGIVVLSMYDTEAYVLEALENGASGYVLKSSGSDDLIKAVREVHAGRKYLGPPLSERAIDMYVRAAQEEEDLEDPYRTLLTDREKEIFQLSARGFTSREIGEKLAISPRTVEKHRSNVLSKLDLDDIEALRDYAEEKGFLVGPPPMDA